jgi:hypothetical protein
MLDGRALQIGTILTAKNDIKCRNSSSNTKFVIMATRSMISIELNKIGEFKSNEFMNNFKTQNNVENKSS